MSVEKGKVDNMAHNFQEIYYGYKFIILRPQSRQKYILNISL